jgi:hypothetical protein
VLRREWATGLRPRGRNGSSITEEVVRHALVGGTVARSEADREALEEGVPGAPPPSVRSERASATPIRPVPLTWVRVGQGERLQHHPELVEDLEVGHVRCRPDEPE